MQKNLFEPFSLTGVRDAKTLGVSTSAQARVLVQLLAPEPPSETFTIFVLCDTYYFLSNNSQI